jgi:hypothetical protein
MCTPKPFACLGRLIYTLARKEATWIGKACDKMVRENKSLAQVLSEYGAEWNVNDVSSREAYNIERRKAFQQQLWAAKNAYYKEIANDPNRDKNVLLGQMTLIVDSLMADGKYKEAAEAILKLAKIAGYVGEGTQVSVFGTLSERDLKDLEEKIGKAGTGTSSSGASEKVQ